MTDPTPRQQVIRRYPNAWVGYSTPGRTFECYTETKGTVIGRANTKLRAWRAAADAIALGKDKYGNELP